MRYTGFVSSAVLFIAVPLFAQNIEIPDPNFLKVLIERGVDTDSDGMISPTEAEAVTVLDVSGDTISELTGLEYFIHLQHLDCSRNFVVDSLDVSALTELVSLRCSLNSIRDLDVSKNNQLRTLICSSNVITKLDLSNNSLLDTLDCNANLLGELDLSGNPSLVWLNCGGNLFTTIELSGNTDLVIFICVDGLLSSLDVSWNSVLETLNCEDNLLDSLDVSNNTALKALGCADNELEALDLSNNLALESLSCGGNPLNHLDVSNNESLLALSCSGMQLTDLDLSTNTALESLICNNTGLKNLDLSLNLSLEMLWCEGNKLNHLDLSNNQMMNYLIISDMPSLYEVCVWDQFTDSAEYNVVGSPNVYFTTECVYNNDSLVFIPDTVLLHRLVELGVDSGGDGLISHTEAESVTKLDLSAQDPEQVIHDLTGIEAFLYLDSLGCDNNNFTELNVSALTDLIYLGCRGTYSDTSGCAGNLQYLDLSANSMLTSLDCSCNPLANLDLSVNASLSDLTLRNMPSLSDVRVWTLPFPPGGVTVDTTGSPNLHFTIDSAGNHVPIPDIKFLYALIEQGVDTDGNGMVSIPEAESVTTLNVNGKGISELTGISYFINMERLDCRNNELANLDLSALPGLVSVLCSDNHLSQLDLSQNTALTRLDCGYNPIKVLDLSMNTLLDSLKIVSNYDLKTLDLSTNMALTYLTCSYIGLSTLNVSQNTELTELSIGAGFLRSLDISNNVKLKKLDCSLNYLSELNLSNNPEMTSLYCHNNYISGLDLSSNPMLKTIYCSGNRLAELDISHQPVLSQLYCEWNILTELDLSYNPKLGELDGSSNDFNNLDLSQNQELSLLKLNNMPSLTEVCVWESFASSGCELYTDGSPNVCFETDCNGICDQTGFDEYNSMGISVYPNPVDNYVTIETGVADLYAVRITSLNGQLVFSELMEGDALQLDLSFLKKGFYILTISSRDFVTSRKIIRL